MNSKQRRALRLALADQGFSRSSYTHDSGDGRYTEEWTRPNSADVVMIEWSVRTPTEENQ
jgi:hypothetical protein